MLQTGICGFGSRLWILLQLYFALFTYVQGSTEEFHFTSEPADVSVLPGGDASLQCVVGGRGYSSEDADSEGGPRVSWRYAPALPLDEAPLLDLDGDQYRSQLSNGSLTLRELGTGAPAGDYQCEASWEGKGTIVSRVATVTLPGLPVFEAEPRDLSVYPGEPAFMLCAVRATVNKLTSAMAQARLKPLDLKVQWLKNDAPLRLDETRMSLLPSGALEIDPAVAQDRGVYRCNVSRHGAPGFRLSNKAMLMINTDLASAETITAPKFIAEPRSQTVIEGNPVTMDCAAFGNPRPDIIWLNNGVAIDLNHLDSRFTMLGTGVLHISSVKELDAGTYQCRADNREDSTDATANLDVQVPPRFVKKPSDKTAVERQDLELECEVYGKPEPTIRWLKNGEVITPNNHDMALVNGYNLRIQGLMVSDAGMFQCVASNPAGNIEASAHLTVQSAVDNRHPAKRKNLFPKTAYKLRRTKPHDILTDQYLSDNPALDDQKQKSYRILTSLISSDQSNFHTKLTGKRDMTGFLNTHAIFDSLKPSSPSKSQQNQFESSLEDRSFDNLGEISPGYTSTTTESLFIDENVNPIVDPRSSPEMKGIQDTETTGPPVTSDPSVEDDGEGRTPSEPDELRAVIVKPRFVTLSWSRPKVAGDMISVYAVVYKVKGSVRERIMNTTRGDVHEMNVPSLQPSTAYQFRVVAYNKYGPGLSTQILEITTQSEDQSLGPPQKLTVVAHGPTALAVSWLSPEPVPGARVTVEKYQLFWMESETGDERSLVTTELSIRLTELRPFTSYSVHVVALAKEEGAGAGAPSEQVDIKTPGDAPSAPPVNVTLEPQTSTSAVMSWEAPPIETRNGDITGFKIKYRRSGKRKADSLTTPADARTVTLRELDRMVTYQVRICAFNINGSGPFTDWQNVDTLQNDLDETQVPDEPSPLNTRSGADSIFMSWAPPPGNQNIKIRGYTLAWGKGIPDVYFQGLGEQARHYTIKNLEPNSEYVISLRANNQIGDGPPVYANVRTKDRSEVTLLGGGLSENGQPGAGSTNGGTGSKLAAPPPPVGLKADILSANTAVVYWTDNLPLKSQFVTDQRYYVVRYSVVDSQRHRYFNSTLLNCMIDELRPFTQYEFAVKVVKGVRESQWSMVVVNQTLEAAPGSHPRELRVSPPPDGYAHSLTLHWLPPNKANGVITGYLILFTTDSARRDRDWVVQAVVGGGTSAPVRSLQPSTAYHFKVQARNAKGYGPFSPVVTYDTPAGNGLGDLDAQSTGKEVRHGPTLTMYVIMGSTVLLVTLAGGVAAYFCCRKVTPHPAASPDSRTKSTYQKSSASNIKPPDLWIHHDQMELKQMDKSHHGSSGSGDGVSGVTSMTLPRPPRDSCEYETAMPGGGTIHSQQNSQGSLDKRHYVPTYVGGSVGNGGDTSTLLRNSSIVMGTSTPQQPPSANGIRSSLKVKPMIAGDPFARDVSMSSINTCGVGSIDPLSHPGLRPVYPRTQYALGQGARAHVTIDQNTPLLSAAGSSLSGTLASQSSISSLGQGLPLHHHHTMGVSPMSCSQVSCGQPPSPSPASEGFPADAREREQGHYVAYEALHPPRDSCEGVGVNNGGSLGRRVGVPLHPLRSFSVPAPPPSDAPHTPHHHNKVPVSITIRPTNTSPYKKPLVPGGGGPGSQVPTIVSGMGAPINRLQQGLSVPHSVEEIESLAPSRSTERLHQEMANLEGLMKDLNAITANQFEC